MAIIGINVDIYLCHYTPLPIQSTSPKKTTCGLFLSVERDTNCALEMCKGVKWAGADTILQQATLLKNHPQSGCNSSTGNLVEESSTERIQFFKVCIANIYSYPVWE